MYAGPIPVSEAVGYDRPSVSERQWSWWGWGYADAALDDAELSQLAARVGALAGVPPPTPRPVPRLADLELPRPRVTPPAAVASFCRDDVADRAAHAMGKAFRDVARALLGRIEHPPDLVAHPRSEADVAAVLEWCSAGGIAVVPYGGGSSVVGGVEPRVTGGMPAVSLDLGGLRRVLDVDTLSRAVHVEAGILGPDLEAALRPSGLSLRHFPQSFERSTLGGWIATRSAGHFATGRTRIDDCVEGLRALTPQGVVETRRLPASGAGPSPDRLLLGSEGTLGVITQAWIRVLARPDHRAATSLRFAEVGAGVEAVRGIVQAGLTPATLRLLDPVEAALGGAGEGRAAVLLLAFESAAGPVEALLTEALELARAAGGVEVPREEAVPDAAARWRATFLRAPYIRDALVRLGWICETFETAITWDAFASLHRRVLEATRAVLDDSCGGGIVAWRLTHAYPDGAAPYYTVVAPGRWGAQVEQWDTIKAAVADAILDAGGSITHHHAVGRDHLPWARRQRPPLISEALRAAKGTVDPAGVLNPGALL